ncbi:AraC-type DNA-binding protein [Robiginitalea myxolifaciens]|uniref:AraC-type DNA-binding protein n=1 Tax=Robiginitalea myxolifaciens TaxID=400055 RepID=A0A1I6GCI2_9FLAO|nr:AraC family transcriptional regulator [Robiginitalea myxolifaciens]SFR39895.1 AraC-type DNA-binding protein [Robiginitalea myxolifaciens]
MKILREHVTLGENELFVVHLFQGEEIDLSYPFHQHKAAFELTFTLGLTGTRMIGDQTKPFSGEDVVLIAPGIPHCWQDHGIANPPEAKIVVIQFLERLYSGPLGATSALKKVSRGLEHSRRGLELKGKNKQEALALLSEADFQDPFENFIFLTRILELFGSTRDTEQLCSQGYVPLIDKNRSTRLETVLNYIQKHYTRKLMVAEVAELLHMSPSAFSHYFKKHTLKSFAHYIMEMRLGKAAQLLHHSDIPIGDVCMESGFQNVSHFNRSFRRTYGTTPLKFRKLSNHFDPS